MKRFDQQDLLRQVLRIEWTERVQVLNHFRGDSLRLAILGPPCTTRWPTAVNASCPVPSSIQSIRAPTATV
jgi:hypothetical protein